MLESLEMTDKTTVVSNAGSHKRPLIRFLRISHYCGGLGRNVTFTGNGAGGSIIIYFFKKRFIDSSRARWKTNGGGRVEN